MPNHKETLSNIVEIVCGETCDLAIFCTTQRSVEDIMDCLAKQAPKAQKVDQVRKQKIENVLDLLNHNHVNRAMAELESLKDWRACLKTHGGKHEEQTHPIPKNRNEGSRSKQK